MVNSTTVKHQHTSSHAAPGLTAHDIEHIVADTVAASLANPGYVGLITKRIQEQLGVQLLTTAAASQALSAQEALTQPAPYNERGDTVMLIARHYYDLDHALTLQLTYREYDEATGHLSFDYTLYQENLFDKAKTRFCTPEPDMRVELERQIGALFNPELLGKSALWTLVTLPVERARHIFPELYQGPAPEPVPESEPSEVQEAALSDQAIYDPPLDKAPPSPAAMGAVLRSTETLDSVFEPVL